MVNKWEIYFCNLNPVQGSEQRGMRPLLVVSNDAVNHAVPVATVLPLSSIKSGDKLYPTEIFLPAGVTSLSKDSAAMVQQIRTVSHNRLINKVGNIEDDEYRREILNTLKEYFEY